jgi:hypothetical protein
MARADVLLSFRTNARARARLSGNTPKNILGLSASVESDVACLTGTEHGTKCIGGISGGILIFKPDET